MVHRNEHELAFTMDSFLPRTNIPFMPKVVHMHTQQQT